MTNKTFAVPTLTLVLALAGFAQAQAVPRQAPLMNADGRYDMNDLLKARDFVKTMPYDASVWPAPAAEPGGGLSPSVWSDIGPGNIGGRVRSLLTHPTNPSILYAGAVAGGIWRSNNAGASWFPLDDFLPNIAVSCLAMDPANPAVIYAGTGEFTTTAGDGAQGAGIFKTTDGGVTWNQLASTAGPTWVFINRIVISPADPNVLLVAQSEGLFHSADGGATWSLRLGGNLVDVEFSPDGSRAVAGSGSDGDAWFSVNGGLNWNPASLDAASGRVETAYAPGNPSVVYALVDQNQGELYRSTDGGVSYSPRNVGNALLGPTGFSDIALWADPTNADFLAFGGARLFRSLDGGLTTADITGILHDGQHVIVRAQNFSAAAPILYVGNDGGVYRTDNYRPAAGTPAFTDLNNELRITQFNGGAGNVASGLIMGGTQDNGSPRYNGSRNAWRNFVGQDHEDGGFVSAAQGLPGGAAVFFGGKAGWNQYRIRYSPAGDELSEEILTGTAETEHVAVPPSILDPNAPSGTLLKGGAALHRLVNAVTAPAGAAWEIIKPAGLSGPISAIAVAPGNSDIIWVGHANGDLYSTSNGTAANPAWTLRINPLPTFLQRFCTDIAFDPSNLGRIYVTFGGFAFDNVYRSEDGGNTWSFISSQLPAVPMHSLVVDPLNPNRIFVGSELGVFGSEDRGDNWSAGPGGPANTSVRKLFWMNKKLAAATHGRGMFTANFNTPPTATITSPANNAAFTGGANVTINATASDAEGPVTRVEFYANGKKLGEDVLAPYSFVFKSVPIGSYALQAKAFDADGDAGLSNVVNITVSGGTITGRSPTADAYVRDGSSAAVNFGTATSLQAKLSSTAGNNRVTYMKYSLSSLTGFLSKVRLRVFGNFNNTNPAPFSMGAYAVSNTSWGETTINWNNRPGLGAPLANILVQSNTPKFYEFDVTDYVRSQRSQGKTTITLAVNGTVVSDPFFTFASREAASNKPQLSFSTISPQALFVVNSTTLPAGDLAISNRLKAMGFTVILKTAAAAVSADANGKALVLISSTVSSGAVAAKFRNAATPVVNWEEAIQDDMGMTGNVSGVDRGTRPSSSQITIQDPSHPLAAGFTGTQTVVSTAGTFSWGQPPAGAAKVGTITGSAFFGVYGYEKDAPMVGMNAPARRVHIFLADSTPTVLTAAGWSLFETAVLWASGL